MDSEAMNPLEGFPKSPAASVDPRGYPPSWVDRLDDWLDALPGPTWRIYAVFALLLVLINAVIKWADGAYPPGTFHPFHVVVMISGVWYMGLIHYLDRAAGVAMDRFRPVLDGPARRLARLEYCLTTMPARNTLVVTVLGILLGIWVLAASMQGVALSPAALAFTSPVSIWFEGAVCIFLNTAFVLFVYHTIHQLRTVNRIYTTSTRIDLFNLTPLYAFSLLSALTAGGGLLLMYAWVATEPDLADDKISLAAALTTGVVALLTFLWPLLGIHRMLATEKIQAHTEVGKRIKLCFDELHRRMDKNFPAEVDTPIKVMAALQQEQAYLDKLPTWPWQPETVRGLATAVLLPIALWIITRVLERIVVF